MAPERGINKKIAAAVLAGGIALGVGGGYVATRGQEQTRPVETPTPSAAAASPEPKNSPTSPTKTAEAPIKSPEVKPAVSCNILSSPELCATGEVVRVKNPQGEVIITYVVFKLPVGTQLFSPIEGQITKAQFPQGASSQGFFAGIFNPNNKQENSYNLTGDIQLPSLSTQNIKPGEAFATIGNRGIINFGDYNLIANVSKFDPTQNKTVTDESTMQKLFPNAR